jgi:hypothetical protein
MSLSVTILSTQIAPGSIAFGANAWFVLSLDGSPVVSSPAFPLSPQITLPFTAAFAYTPSPDVIYLYVSLCTFRGPSNEAIALARARSRIANLPLNGITCTMPLISPIPPANAIVTLALSLHYAPALVVPLLPAAAPVPQPPPAPQPLYPPLDELDDDDNPYANLPENSGVVYPA